MTEAHSQPEPTGYQKYLQRRNDPKPPDSKDYIRLSESGKK